MKLQTPLHTTPALLLMLAVGCQSQSGVNDTANTDTNESLSGRSSEAAITSAQATGQPGSYTFSVTIESSDTGCEQYADWWEVLSPDGKLIYRRILAHSHVDEQPFTRSGGPVTVAIDDEVIVRAHMNNSGYGEQVFRGTVSQGFNLETLNREFASELALTEPLPTDCAF